MHECASTCVCEVLNKSADEKLKYQELVRTAGMTSSIAATQEKDAPNNLKKGK